MSITVIVVNYYTKELLPKLLQNVLAQSLISQIIIVDNSQELDNFDYPSQIPIDIIHNKENIGFGKAVNQAIPKSRGDYLLVLNPDLELLDNCVELLITAAKQYNSFIVGPRFYWDKNLQFRLPPGTGGCFWLSFADTCAQLSPVDAAFISFYWNMRHDRFWSNNEPFIEPFLVGACLLINRNFVDANQNKIFDERFFLYFEDNDLGIQNFLKGNYSLCVPQAKAIHFTKSPSQNNLEMLNKSHHTFLEKYYPQLQLPQLKTTPLTHPTQNLGKFKEPPTIQIKQPPAYLEIALTPHFVPFAQTQVEQKTFTIPPEIWQQLSPGNYYSRLRSINLGHTLEVYSWEKL